MPSKKEKIILFPKGREELEEESIRALKEKRYEVALQKLNELIEYNIHSHEIIVAKLICLMELNRYEEAQHLCEEVMDLKDGDYYHYVHIYVTILFQTGQYVLLMEQVENELHRKNVPTTIRQQFEQLYDMSMKLEKDQNENLRTQFMDDLLQAVHNEEHHEQWRIIKWMKTKKLLPNKKIIGLLKKENVHPVIKTTIFQWLQAYKVDELIIVQKFGMEQSIYPLKTNYLDEHPLIEQILEQLKELEQDNPTLFQMIKQVLYRYLYVLYPILPSTSNVVSIAEALQYIAERDMNLHNHWQPIEQTVKSYIDEIDLCQKLFLSVIEA